MFKLTWRNLLARKMRLLMSALAIVLGVGFLAGVLTFSNGLSRTFDGIIEGSTPDAMVRPSGTNPWEQAGAGGSVMLTPDDVRALADLPEVAQADGSVDGTGLYVLDEDDKLVGTSGAPTLAFNYADTPNMLGEPTLELEDGAWPAAPDEVVLDTRSAENAGYEVGDTVTVIPPTASGTMAGAGPGAEGPGTEAPGAGLTEELTLVGTANFAGGGMAGATLVIFDTAGAQQMFLGGADAFTSVSLTAAEDVSQKELVDAATVVLPKGFEAAMGDDVVEESANTIGELLGFITIFLTTFAVIAVIVGGFIIANTFSILVAQRIRELALLRALGASRVQVRRSVILEAFLMALIGSTLGLVVGVVLARGLAGLFSAVGLEIDSEVLNLTPSTIAAAYAVGIVVTVVSAVLPARRAAKVAPVAAMREDAAMSEGSLRRRTLIGAVLLVLGAGAAAVGVVGGPGNDALWIGIGAVIWVLTVAAISAVLGRPVLALCRAVFAKVFGTPGRLAGDNAIRNPRRTGATASALMIGLTLVSAVGVLAASMSKSIDSLVDEQFESDFLVQSPVFGSFPVGVGDAMADVDGVEVVSHAQAVVTSIDGAEQPEFVVAFDDAFADVYALPMVEGEESMSGTGALLTEAGADKYGLELGDTFTMSFPGIDPVELEVTGIAEDSQVVSLINVSFDLLAQVGMTRVDHTLSINLADGADASAVKEELEGIVEDLPIVAVQDKEEFGDTVKGQVNQLLYMIYGLLALSIVIAVIGIVNTLSLSVLERTREIGLLRAVGLSRRRLRRMVTLESVTISLMGAVLGLVLGVLIGVLLQRSLSDDLPELALPMGNLLLFLVIAVVFGVLAAIVPAVRASRMKVLDAIATE